jgi:hypothetical protein
MVVSEFVLNIFINKCSSELGVLLWRQHIRTDTDILGG